MIDPVRSCILTKKQEETLKTYIALGYYNHFYEDFKEELVMKESLETKSDDIPEVRNTQTAF